MPGCPAAAEIKSAGCTTLRRRVRSGGAISSRSRRKYGQQTEVYDGVDVTMNAPFGKGGVLAGGFSTGRTVSDNCFQNSDPSLFAQGVSTTSTTPLTQDFCHIVLPFEGQTQFKFSGAYPLPWDFQASATYQNLPGIPVSSTYVASNAVIRPSLGRNLGQCATSATCNGTVVNRSRCHRISSSRIASPSSISARPGPLPSADARAGHIRHLQRAQRQPDSVNQHSVRASWQQPTEILAARIVKFGAQLSF